MSGMILIQLQPKSEFAVEIVANENLKVIFESHVEIGID